MKITGEDAARGAQIAFMCTIGLPFLITYATFGCLGLVAKKLQNWWSLT